MNYLSCCFCCSWTFRFAHLGNSPDPRIFQYFVIIARTSRYCFSFCCSSSSWIFHLTISFSRFFIHYTIAYVAIHRRPGRRNKSCSYCNCSCPDWVNFSTNQLQFKYLYRSYVPTSSSMMYDACLLSSSCSCSCFPFKICCFRWHCLVWKLIEFRPNCFPQSEQSTVTSRLAGDISDSVSVFSPPSPSDILFDKLSIFLFEIDLFEIDSDLLPGSLLILSLTGFLELLLLLLFLLLLLLLLLSVLLPLLMAWSESSRLIWKKKVARWRYGEKIKDSISFIKCNSWWPIKYNLSPQSSQVSRQSNKPLC